MAQPEWRAPDAKAVPLDALVPAAALAPRDPRTGFSTVSSVLSATSASGTPGRGVASRASAQGVRVFRAGQVTEVANP